MSLPPDRPEPARQPLEAPVEPARQPASLLPVRAILIVVGTVSLGLGIVGIFLPVVPTTPFVLLAAACYARASTRLYGWLLGQPTLGPIITEWRRSRSMAPGVRRRALVLVALTFGVSIVLVDSLALRLALAAVGLIVVSFLYRIPTTD